MVAPKLIFTTAVLKSRKSGVVEFRKSVQERLINQSKITSQNIQEDLVGNNIPNNLFATL